MTLKQARENAGKSVLDVANALNISPQAVYRWERGETLPTLENMVKLSQLYYCDLEDIVPHFRI